MVPAGQGETNGVRHDNQKKICGEIFKRYQKAGKKGKGRILAEYAPLLGYNRDYLAYQLTNWGKTCYAHMDGKVVKFTAKPAVQSRRNALTGKKTGREAGKI